MLDTHRVLLNNLHEIEPFSARNKCFVEYLEELVDKLNVKWKTTKDHDNEILSLLTVPLICS